MLIGITGTDGAGKGAAVSYLAKEKGFVHYSARALLIEELSARKQESDRANLRLMANELRAAHGHDFLVKCYLKKKNEDQVNDAIIESIRTTAEAKTLKENGGILLAIDADQKVRYERIIGRKSESDRVSFEEFVAHEKLEMNDPDPHGMQKAEVIEMADHTIMNDGSLKELGKKLEIFLEKIQY